MKGALRRQNRWVEGLIFSVFEALWVAFSRFRGPQGRFFEAWGLLFEARRMVLGTFEPKRDPERPEEPPKTIPVKECRPFRSPKASNTVLFGSNFRSFAESFCASIFQPLWRVIWSPWGVILGAENNNNKRFRENIKQVILRSTLTQQKQQNRTFSWG